MAEESGQFNNVRITDAAGIKATIRDLAGNDALNVAIVDGSGNQITSFGGTSMTDDAAFTAGSSSVVPVGGIVTADSVDSGDVGAFAMLANRQQKITIYDSSGVEVTSFGGGTQYTEDAAAAANPVGNAMIMVRADSLAGLTTTDGDNVAARGTDKGELYVKHVDALTVNSHAVTNAGTFAVQVDGSALTALQLIDNLVLAEDAVHNTGDPGVQMLGVRQNTQSDFAADGDYVPLSIGDSGGVRVQLSGYDLALAVTDNSSSLTVDNGGTFAVQVDGNALTSLQLIDDPVVVLGTATYTEASSKGNIMAAVRRDADTALVDTTNEFAPLIVDARGLLKVEAFSGETLPVSLASVPSHAVTNAGTFAVQVDGSALTALQLIDDPVFADDAAFTIGTSKVMMVGFTADETATDSLDEGDAGAGRITLDRKQIVTLYPHTAGGLSVAQLNGADGGGGVLVATAQAIKASAGQLYGYYIYNPNSSATFVHFYNTAAASVTVGTTNPLVSLTIPALSAANMTFPYGVTFSNAGWSAAATTTAGGNTAPSTGLDVTVFYA